MNLSIKISKNILSLKNIWVMIYRHISSTVSMVDPKFCIFPRMERMGKRICIWTIMIWGGISCRFLWKGMNMQK